MAVLVGLLSSVAYAAGEQESRTEILLMTMGPGESLYAQGGHAALMVAQMRGAEVVHSDVYNFGDTDWEDESLPWKFLTGTLDFRLDKPGDMYKVAEDYGYYQNRDVVLQQLALTPSQAREVATRLESTLAPDRRGYRYHYVDAICTTKIRDLLDEVLGGPIRAQLESKVDPMTIRDYQRRAFDGYPLAGFGADLLMGRRNDVPIDEYRSLFHPDAMRARFQKLRVPDPGGGSEDVPLASAPKMLAGRDGPPLATGQTLGGAWVLGLLALVFAVKGVQVRKMKAAPDQRTRALGRWSLGWSLVCGSMSLVVVTVMMISSVPEFVENELILTFVPLDLWLLWPALKWTRGADVGIRRVHRYAMARVVLATIVLVARVPGWLYQEPLAPPVFVLGGFAMLAYLTARARDA